jgi:hypothetical protein
VAIFVFKSDEDFPEQELRAIFKKCLDKAKNCAWEEMKIVPNHFIVTVDSALLDYGINSHFKQINNSSIDELMSYFEKVDQSNKAKGRDAVCGDRFKVDVWAVQTKGVPRKRKLEGAGRRNFRDYGYNVYPGALYDHQPFPPSLCLFYALEWCRQKHLLTRHAFRKWRRNERRQATTVAQLMRVCGIARGRNAYSIEEYGQRIQVKELQSNNYEG